MFQNMIEFFEYMNTHVESGSMFVGFFTCMMFDVLFSASSCLIEKAWEIMARRKKMNKPKKNLDNFQEK